MDAFVTGATGFLGQNVIDTLLARGWRVTALVRSREAAARLGGRGVSVAEGDLGDAESVARALPQGVDAFFHVAADVSMWVGHRDRLHRVNVEGTVACLAAAARRGAKRFVLTSTSGVFGVPSATFDETAPLLGEGSRNPYFATKAEAERRALESGLDVVVLNPGHIVGPYDHAGWITIADAVRAGKFPAVPPGRGTFAHAARVAEAHESAARRGRAGERYLLGGAEAAYREVTDLCARLHGVPPVRRTAPRALLRASAWIADRVGRLRGVAPEITPGLAEVLCGTMSFRSDKAVRELGYAPAGLDQMFTDALAWQARRAEGAPG